MNHGNLRGDERTMAMAAHKPRLSIAAYLERVRDEIARLDDGSVEQVCDLIERAYHDRRRVFICGNGGSGANASHLAEDLSKGTLSDFDTRRQKRLKVIALTDATPAILAWGNDEGYDTIFVEQLKNLAEPGDLLLAISGSGNSPNVLRAVDWARQHGVISVGITGYDGGKLRAQADHALHVDSQDMGMVESLHLVVFHWWIDELRARFAKTMTQPE